MTGSATRQSRQHSSCQPTSRPQLGEALPLAERQRRATPDSRATAHGAGAVAVVLRSRPATQHGRQRHRSRADTPYTFLLIHDQSVAPTGGTGQVARGPRCWPIRTSLRVRSRPTCSPCSATCGGRSTGGRKIWCLRTSCLRMVGTRMSPYSPRLSMPAAALLAVLLTGCAQYAPYSDQELADRRACIQEAYRGQAAFAECGWSRERFSACMQAPRLAEPVGTRMMTTARRGG